MVGAGETRVTVPGHGRHGRIHLTDGEDLGVHGVEVGTGNRHWARRGMQRYYEVVEMLFSPDLFVVGGGISKDHKKFFKYLKLETPMVPAQLLNRAGIIGAAWQAQWRLEHPDATEEEVVKAAKKAKDAD